jgi:NADPH-dependent ferric siderophore reductase
MGIQYADDVKQPGETLRYSMEFVPGRSLATGDSLSGSPTVTVKRISDGVDVTADSAGPPAIAGMLEQAATRAQNIVYAFIEGGTDGESYRVTFTCDTTFGEHDVEEDLVIQVKEL